MLQPEPPTTMKNVIYHQRPSPIYITQNPNNFNWHLFKPLPKLNIKKFSNHTKLNKITNQVKFQYHKSPQSPSTTIKWQISEKPLLKHYDTSTTNDSQFSHTTHNQSNQCQFWNNSLYSLTNQAIQILRSPCKKTPNEKDQSQIKIQNSQPFQSSTQKDQKPQIRSTSKMPFKPKNYNFNQKDSIFTTNDNQIKHKSLGFLFIVPKDWVLINGMDIKCRNVSLFSQYIYILWQLQKAMQSWDWYWHIKKDTENEKEQSF